MLSKTFSRVSLFPAFELPTPASLVTSDPVNGAGISLSWMPYIIGQLDRLLEPDRWAGDDNDKYAATQGIEQIIDLLLQEQSPVIGGYGVLYTSIGQYDFSADSDGILLYLPALWRHIRLDLNLRGTGAGYPNIGIRFDEDDINPHYRYHDVTMTTTSTYNQGTWNRIPIRGALCNPTNPADFYHRTVVDIYNPKDAGASINLRYHVSGYFRQYSGMGNWTETPANPETISILPEWGQIAAGSELMIAIGERSI